MSVERGQKNRIISKIIHFKMNICGEKKEGTGLDRGFSVSEIICSAWQYF